MAPGVLCRQCQQPDCCTGAIRRGRIGTRRSARLRPDPDGVDYISALPDDLLLQVLARLLCARLAAHTSLLARRWRGLWTRLPEVTLRHVAPDPLDAALSRIAHPELALLDVRVLNHHELTPDRVSSLLRTAARLAPAKLYVNVRVQCLGRTRDAIELPCFHRTTSISLDILDSYFTLPAAGDFPALETLHLTLSFCGIDLPDFLPRCPRLRMLWVYCWVLGSITVHSPSIEELVVMANGQMRHLDIDAPLLKKLKVRFCIGNKFSVSFSAPLVEEISWYCVFQTSHVGYGMVWRLGTLELKTVENLVHRMVTSRNENTCLQPQHRRGVHVLKLLIRTNETLAGVTCSFREVIAQLPVKNFSVLDLHLTTNGHVYGAIVLHLLGICTFINRLELVLNPCEEREACSVICSCDQPNNWRSQIISLTNLEEVEIRGFKGEGHEVDFLRLLCRCTTMLKRITVELSNDGSTRDTGCMVHSILKAYPDVECNVFRNKKRLLS